MLHGAAHLPPLRLGFAAVVMLLLGACASVDVGGPVAGRQDPNAGILTLPSGKTVRILPETLNYTGPGTYVWPDGREQSGDWVAGKLHGMGSETTPGETYTGQWRNGARHGHGELHRRAADLHYLGDFRDNLPHGSGTQTTTEGSYRGDWRGGEPHGHGQYHGKDGAAYEGQWVAGTRSGYGRAVDAAGSQYEGDWLDDRAHGFGTRMFADGSVYSGSWLNGERDGYGKLTTAAALVYEGTWRADVRQGFGREDRPDRSYYVGDWADGKRHGQGAEVFADGRRHDGTWESGFLLGPGTRTHSSGVRLTGLWNQNLISNGLLALPTGAEFAGPLFKRGGTVVGEPLLDWLTQQAVAGDPYAQLYLASAYLDFEEPAPDPQTAQVWLKRSAAAGVPDAQFRLSLLVMDTDRGKHLALLESAAGAGHARAHELLGEFYHVGNLVARDLTAAASHYEAAIGKGSIAAANNLAWLLATAADTGIADPERAIEIIQPIYLYYGDWQHLDTLAAAQARAGNIELAVRMQKQALLDAKNQVSDAGVTELEERLTLYETGQPYTE